MADDDKRTLKEKLLFYTTAFFILLGIFSLFAFLFLVPFVIEPGFTTIFMQFDTRPAVCRTVDVVHRRGVKNCTWSSCREGCTKELFECIQIRVDYMAAKNETNDTDIEPTDGYRTGVERHRLDLGEALHYREPRGLRDYSDYDDEDLDYGEQSSRLTGQTNAIQKGPQVYDKDVVVIDDDGVRIGSDGDWFLGAKLFPNVKGCGYPPSLNCTIWTKKYKTEGTNFTCYYSRVDPGLVVSDLDLWQNTLNLIYSLAIPIPSFIISVIYLAVAYFKIYSVDEDKAPLDKNAEEIADDDELGASSADCCDQEDVEEDVLCGELGDDEICIVLETGSLPEGLADDDAENVLLPSKSNSGPLPLTNSTDLASSIRGGGGSGDGAQGNGEETGSRGSTEHGVISSSGSIPGYLAYL